MAEMKVLKSLVEITRELSQKGISKDRKNAQQGYEFRGIDDVYNELSGLLAKHSVVIAPSVSERSTVERVSKTGSAVFYTTVKVDYTIFSSEDGSEIKCTTFGEAMDSADKATNKAMSAAYKYLCLQLFCIPTEGDNDADATTPDPVKPINKAPKAQPKKKEPTLKERFDACLKYLSSIPEKSLKIGDEKTSAMIGKVNDLLEELQAAGRANEYKQLNETVNSKLFKDFKDI